MYDEDAEFDKLILLDVDDTLARLQAEKVRLEGLRAGMHVAESRELLKNYKINEPLREGIAKLEGELGDMKHALARVHVRMHHEEDYVKCTEDAAARARGRDVMFDLQLTTALQMIRAEEVRGHLKAVTSRAGPQPTELEVDRAAAQLEMHEHLGEQLVDVTRLISWFEKKKEEAAA